MFWSDILFFVVARFFFVKDVVRVPESAPHAVHPLPGGPLLSHESAKSHGGHPPRVVSARPDVLHHQNVSKYGIILTVFNGGVSHRACWHYPPAVVPARPHVLLPPECGHGMIWTGCFSEFLYCFCGGLSSCGTA